MGRAVSADMGSIFRVSETDVAWFDYEPGIRVKALTRGRSDVPSTQYVEYGPHHTDPVHSHDTDEVFVVMAGELWVEGLDRGSGPASIVFIPRDTPYAVRAGAQGVRYFRIVVS
jgi:quercetin dioxygenase-like cupin family protein